MLILGGLGLNSAMSDEWVVSRRCISIFSKSFSLIGALPSTASELLFRQIEGRSKIPDVGFGVVV
jgi:hypothetical protein